jgi:hypothetical protein
MHHGGHIHGRIPLFEDGPVDAVEEGSIIFLDGGLVSTTDLFGTVFTGSPWGWCVVWLSAQRALACT